MNSFASLEIILGSQTEIHSQYLMNNTLSFKIPLSCPNCLDQSQRISTWGTYPTKIDERARFYCYTCTLSFNSAKIPFWKDNLYQMIWRLAQLTIEDKISIHSLSKKWSIPETTLRVLIAKIKELLASAFERAKQLEQLQNLKLGIKTEGIKIIVYDEGFLKLLGIQAYLLFTLDGNGKPITLCIESNRGAETIYNHFLSAMTQMGGLDVIISDAAPAILSAARALRHDLLLVMQVHQNDGKRARLIKLETVPNKKKLIETTVELHTGSLLLNSESELTVSKKTRYPKKFSGTSNYTPKTKRSKKT